MTTGMKASARAMRGLWRSALLAAVLCAGLAPTQTAQAVPVTFSTSGTVLATFFAGQGHQSTGRFLGSSFPAPFPVTTTVDLTPGVALAHTVNLFEVTTGPHPGGLGGATESKDFVTAFASGFSNGGGMTQRVTYTAVANGQFQVDIGASGTVTLNLGALGLLDVTMLSSSFQVPGGSNGVQAGARATLLLRDAAAPAPAPATLALLGLGLAGLGVMRRWRS